MHINRRDILKVAIAGSLAAAAPSVVFSAEHKASKPLRILILGGTGFIGPHMVQTAVDRGHEVTLFNRGTVSELFPGLEQLTGDRDGQLESLEGKSWDAVIDNSGYVPGHVKDSAKLLSKTTPHYLYISTVAVYKDLNTPDMDENSPLATIEDESIEEVTGETYGPLKALCESMVKTYYAEDARTILRPTYIVGPGDTSDRFIYYIDRPMAGGRMPVPGPKDAPLSYVDVRDLAEFTIHTLEEKITGTDNIVSPPGRDSIGELMDLSLTASGAGVDLVWVPEQVQADKHDEIREFPMFPPPALEGGLSYMSQSAAVGKGFSNRPFKDTVAATYEWWMAQPPERRQNKRQVFPEDVQRQWLQAVAEAEANAR